LHHKPQEDYNVPKDNDILINPKEYQIINKSTGVVVDMDVIMKKCDAKGWQKTYAKSLAGMVDCGGGVAKVIAYILKNKNVDNMIIGTYQQIADKSGVSKRTVATAFKELSSKGFLRVKSPSCYMLDPNVMRYGSAGKGVALITVWANI
jgi:hypothetical protein